MWWQLQKRRAALLEERQMFNDHIYYDLMDSYRFLHIKEEKYVLVETRIINATVVEERGVYAPMTNEGNIIVEDVLASCMTIIRSPLLQRNFVLQDLMSLLRLNNKYKDETPLPLGTTWMLDLMKYVLPHMLPST
ncbi:hint module domain-containing protein [Ditylenchus destructor]|uniref:Hint module domain-containing protein n=1 Tax=Ditylenchus destructor TaxID=166010 RepID=A0AAD4R7W7_9BILA|nr:hint module domain-containing protein [Ditylenchus destructor]